METLVIITIIALVVILYWIPSGMAIKRGRSGWLTLAGSVVSNPLIMVVIIALMGHKEKD